MENISSIVANKEKYNSFSDKTLKGSIKLKIKCFLIGLFTLGLAYPWIICMKENSRCKHTVVCGKRLKFIGNPKELTRNWFFWWLLTVLTFGLYSLVVKVRFDQWIASNTIFEEVEIIE